MKNFYTLLFYLTFAHFCFSQSSFENDLNAKTLVSVETSFPEIRRIDLSKRFLPVYDQRQGQAEVAYTVKSLLEYYLFPAEGPIYIDIDSLIKDANENNGATFEAVLNPIESNGLDCFGHANGIVKISGYTQLYKADIDTNEKIHVITKSLRNNHPVLVGMLVTDSFDDRIKKSNSLYIPSALYSRNGKALIVVGFDDDKEELLLRNTWGMDWGDDGYFRLPYEYVDDLRYAYVFDEVKIKMNKIKFSDLLASNPNEMDQQKLESMVYHVLKTVGFEDLKVNVVADKVLDESIEDILATWDIQGAKQIVFSSQWNTQEFTMWNIFMILAHELYKLVTIDNPDTIGDNYSHRKLVLDSDEWSGFVLKNLGATLAEAISVFDLYTNQEKASYTHPPTDKRVAAVLKGWKKGAK